MTLDRRALKSLLHCLWDALTAGLSDDRLSAVVAAVEPKIVPEDLVWIIDTALLVVPFDRAESLYKMRVTDTSATFYGKDWVSKYHNTTVEHRALQTRVWRYGKRYPMNKRFVQILEVLNAVMRNGNNAVMQNGNSANSLWRKQRLLKALLEPTRCEEEELSDETAENTMRDGLVSSGMGNLIPLEEDLLDQTERAETVSDLLGIYNTAMFADYMRMLPVLSGELTTEEYAYELARNPGELSLTFSPNHVDALLGFYEKLWLLAGTSEVVANSFGTVRVSNVLTQVLPMGYAWAKHEEQDWPRENIKLLCTSLGLEDLDKWLVSPTRKRRRSFLG